MSNVERDDGPHLDIEFGDEHPDDAYDAGDTDASPDGS